MKLGSAIAVYFVIWWIVLFAILPLGVRNAHESGKEIGAGHDPGAPVDPQLVRKAAITTAVAAVVFAFVYLAMTRDWLGLAPQ